MQHTRPSDLGQATPENARPPMRISFVVPAYNEEFYIADCLRSILRLRGPWVHEIIVVDNGSTDRTVEIAHSFPGVRVVHEPRKGVTRARQKGLESATGDLLAMIDADNQIVEGWLQSVQRHFGAERDLACLIGEYDFFDLKQWKKLLRNTLKWILALVLPRQPWSHARGGNTVYRLSALREVGGFNTNVQFYGEDVEILRRVGRVGKIAFEPDMIVKSSARRINSESFLKIAFLYKASALLVSLGKKPLINFAPKDWRIYKDGGLHHVRMYHHTAIV